MTVDWLRFSIRFIVCGLIVACASPQARAQCERQRLQADLPQNGDFLGSSVTISGDWAAAGLSRDSTNGAQSGAVLIFRRNVETNAWSQVQRITPPDSYVGHRFGTGVVLDGDVLLASAIFDDDLGTDTGSVYVYRLDAVDTHWVYEAEIHASDAAPLSRFGSALSLRNGVAAICNSTSSANARLYLFRDQGKGDWTQETTLTSANANATIGQSVATDGEHVVVGVQLDEYQVTDWVEIYRWNPATMAWQFVQQLGEPSSASDYVFGICVAIDSGRILVGGANFAGPSPHFETHGDVCSYNADTGLWQIDQRLDGADAHINGLWRANWVDLRGDIAVIGTPTPVAGGAGQVSLYRRESDNWNHVGDIAPSSPPSSNRFGLNVAIRGDVLMTGAPDYDYQATTIDAPGAVYFVDVSGLDCNDNVLCDDVDIALGTSDDINSNGVPDECDIQGDVDGDGQVNVNDLLEVLLSWGLCPPAPAECPADIDPPFAGDQQVNINDLLVVINNWGAHL